MRNQKNNGKKVGHSDPNPEHGNDNNKHKNQNKGGNDSLPGKSHASFEVF